MLDSDFFSYCTSVKLVELKAMGQLSHVRHLGEGETIYSSGDPGDTLFIINRGVVEVIQPGQTLAGAHLSRGHVLGDVEIFSGLPRKQTARTCGTVSLQCFERKDFPELIRRVPSFFHFLSSQLASRLAQADDVATTESNSLELGGNLSNFDLVTVYQTITNSSQTGQLRISNAAGELVSAFFFQRGQPRCGQFGHLTGEEAFWQLFGSDQLAGTFSFTTTLAPEKDWIQSNWITKNAGEMLINALQGQDEFAELRQKFAEGGKTLQRNKTDFAWPASATPELLTIAAQVWQLAATRPVTVDELFRRCAVCEFKIYQVVDELLRSRHFIWSHEALNARVA